MPDILTDLIALAEAHPLTAMAIGVVVIAYINLMTSGPHYH